MKNVLITMLLFTLSLSAVYAQRPQDPVPPLPYEEQRVRFFNANANVWLAGTITYPSEGGPFPAAVLVTGSGAQNRDEELVGHRPFLVIADHLTRNGIAVLRYDDRGFGESTGNFNTATTADLAADARTAVEYLASRNFVNASQVGLIGHSEGGLIAPVVAENNPDLAYIISLAGTGISGREIILLQGVLINRAAGVPEEDNLFFDQIRRDIIDIVLAEPNNNTADQNIKSYLDENLPNFTRRQRVEYHNAFRQYLSVWFRYFLTFDPFDKWAKVTIPVLALNGSVDVQVPPKENLNAIEEAVTSNGNMNYTGIELPGLNHLFQHSETGAPSEYGLIEETFDINTLHLMTDWIHGIFTPTSVDQWMIHE